MNRVMILFASLVIVITGIFSLLVLPASAETEESTIRVDLPFRSSQLQQYAGLESETPVKGSSPGSLSNPLGINDPRIIIGNVVNAVLGLVGSLALAVFIYGGLNWVTSAGNEEKVKKGRDMIIWASFGLAVIFASYTLVGFVLDALTGTG